MGKAQQGHAATRAASTRANQTQGCSDTGDATVLTFPRQRARCARDQEPTTAPTGLDRSRRRVSSTARNTVAALLSLRATPTSMVELAHR